MLCVLNPQAVDSLLATGCGVVSWRVNIRLLPVFPGFQAAQRCDLSPSFYSTGLIMWRGSIVGGGGDCCRNMAPWTILHRTKDITMRPQLRTFFLMFSELYLLQSTWQWSTLGVIKSAVIHFIPTYFKCLHKLFPTSLESIMEKKKISFFSFYADTKYCIIQSCNHPHQPASQQVHVMWNRSVKCLWVLSQTSFNAPTGTTSVRLSFLQK